MYSPLFLNFSMYFFLWSFFVPYSLPWNSFLYIIYIVSLLNILQRDKWHLIWCCVPFKINLLKSVFKYLLHLYWIKRHIPNGLRSTDPAILNSFGAPEGLKKLWNYLISWGTTHTKWQLLQFLGQKLYVWLQQKR